MRFEGKVALITGGAAGFGRAFADAFAAEGAAIVIADVDSEAAEEAAAALRGAGHRAMATPADVAQEASVVSAVAAAVDAFDGIDILVNNAARHLSWYSQPFATLPRDDLRDMLAVNVVGVVNCTLACQPSMAQRGGGAVVNIASVAGHTVTSPYGISKLAVRGLTVALASELAPHRIRVNAVSPGLMATPNAMRDLPQELKDDYVDRRQLVHRMGTIDDVTSAVLFLCSADASFITGETIRVSGGYPAGI